MPQSETQILLFLLGIRRFPKLFNLQCETITRATTVPIHSSILYSVMQSDGNSWKINTFREALISELMISS